MPRAPAVALPTQDSYENLMNYHQNFLCGNFITRYIILKKSS